ncbi:cytochrome c oxidase assembly protein [Streptomyces pratensis]|uniref:cytochrome c oxidase assembly protein n=1 Tax=Streptomyces pratensis TaxID=1169025 RepID=UPI0030165947
MTLAHTPGTALFEQILAGAASVAAVAYGAAAVRLERRGDTWPRWRVASFTAGSTGVLWVVLGPQPGPPFTAHMVGHLIMGMAAPLFLVLARPLTLALRALPPGPARRGLLAVAHAPPVNWSVFPPLAALIDLGGLWLLYRTELFATVQHRPLGHAVMQAHVLVAGLLFTFSVCQLDPVRHRRRLALRGATLLVAGAAHAVLATSLYATPPPGTAYATTDLQTGAQVMYYGGDVVEAALGAVLAASWYRAVGRARANGRRRSRTGCTVRAEAGPRPEAAARRGPPCGDTAAYAPRPCGQPEIRDRLTPPSHLAGPSAGRKRPGSRA